MKIFKDKYLYIKYNELPSLKKIKSLNLLLSELRKNNEILGIKTFMTGNYNIIYLNKNVGIENRLEYVNNSYLVTKDIICCDFIILSKSMATLSFRQIRNIKKIYDEYSIWQMKQIKKEFFKKCI